MQRLTYLPEPGFVYDLLQRFHINYEYRKDPDVIPDAHSTEIQSFFAEPPEALRVFFDENSAGAPMLMTRYFERFSQILSSGTYNYAFFCKQLTDLPALARNMTVHFFPRLPAREIDAASADLRRITHLISESDYPADVQNRLLCFYIEPERYQKLLLSELDVQAARLRAYYEQNALLVQHIRDTLNLETLSEQFNSIPDMKDYLDVQGAAMFSCTIVDKQVVACHHGTDGTRFLLFGLNYQSTLEAIARKLGRPNLSLFGKILSEPKRLRLLDALLDGRAMRKDDICTLLGLSMTATHYHIDMMARAWMLCCENRGRTFYYSLNRSYFDDIINALKKYGTPEAEDGEQTEEQAETPAQKDSPEPEDGSAEQAQAE